MVKTIRLIYASYIAGALLFAGVSYNKIQNQNSGNIAGDESLQIIVLVIAIIMAFAGQIMSRVLIKDFKPSGFKLKEKYIEKYRLIKLIQAASIEGGSLLNISIYFISGNNLNLYFGLGILVGMVFLFPSEKDLYKLFKISEKDLEDLPKEVDDRF